MAGLIIIVIAIEIVIILQYIRWESELKEQASQGILQAQYELAREYQHFPGKKPNEAMRLFEQTAKNGHVQAQLALALQYKEGNSIAKKDSVQAAYWFQKAADQGLADAQYYLALCYRSGEGGEKNSQQAAQWFEKAAEQNHADAQCELGLCYMTGCGVNKDENMAIHWFQKAVDNGLVSALEHLNEAMWLLEQTAKSETEVTKESNFDGGLLQLIGWSILGVLVTLLTLGICFPWAVCMIQNWRIKHTVINGYRLLQFDGKGISLFGNWIKWWLLTIITLGIYGLWVPIKMEKWIVKNTFFMKKAESNFDGGLLQLIGWSILGVFVTVLTLGICFPWAVCMLQNWRIKHTVISGRRLQFNGKGIDLFVNWIIWYLLTIITLGIYGLWIPIKMEKWIVKNTSFVN